MASTSVGAPSSQVSEPIDHGLMVPVTPLVSFLQRLQETAFITFGSEKFDPKTYVDLSLKFDLPTVQQAFNDLPRTQTGSVLAFDLQGFLKEYLNGSEEDMECVEPVDFVDEPNGFLPKVEHRVMRDWAVEVHSLWKKLSRKASVRVLEHPELHTLLPLEFPGVIPGSRFREVYYWDSYWVIRGLLASKMNETAKGIVNNLISFIDTHGYVLNGARAYYTNRSQPPFLSSMVIEVYKRTGDMDMVKKALPALIKEHKFWNSGIHKVIIEDTQGSMHTLSRYYAMWNQPRPESTINEVYKWDVCYQNQDIFVSNFIPLWIHLFNSDEVVVEKVVKSLQSSGLLQVAGIATSLTNSGQQWDFPNGWAPIQHMIVEGLVESGLEDARLLAKDIVMRWLKTNYVAYKKSNTMHEKYDVTKCGEFGGGGLYAPQTGFGWSNGVVLAFLEEFGWPEDLNPD